MEIIKKNDGGELSEFIYYDNFFDKTYHNSIFNWITTLNFIKGYKNNGTKIDREQIWFDKNNNYFCKVWKTREERWKANAYDKKLTEIENKIKNKLGIDIDTCLVNKYNSGNDSISAHKDSTFSFGEYPHIIIYSLGSEREMKINSDINKKSFKVKLKSNSIFIMRGGSQKYFTHEIIKDKSKGVRYSLTFRKYLK